MICALLVIMEVTKLSHSKNGEKVKRVLVEKYLEDEVRCLDLRNDNIEFFRKKLYKAFEHKMEKEIKNINKYGICEEEIKSSFMNLMLKRYCLNSTFNLGLLSILSDSWLGVQPAPLEVTSEYLRSINYTKRKRRVKFLSWLAEYFPLSEQFLFLILGILNLYDSSIILKIHRSVTWESHSNSI